MGGNFTATILMLALWCALCFLVPLDSVLLVSYAGDYYKFNEMWKGGLPVTLATMVFFSAFLLVVPPMLGAM